MIFLLLFLHHSFTRILFLLNCKHTIFTFVYNKAYNFLKSNYVKMLLINGISCPQTAPFAPAYSLFDLMTSDFILQKQCAKCMYG